MTYIRFSLRYVSLVNTCLTYCRTQNTVHVMVNWYAIWFPRLFPKYKDQIRYKFPLNHPFFTIFVTSFVNIDTDLERKNWHENSIEKEIQYDFINLKDGQKQIRNQTGTILRMFYLYLQYGHKKRTGQFPPCCTRPLMLYNIW